MSSHILIYGAESFGKHFASDNINISFRIDDFYSDTVFHFGSKEKFALENSLMSVISKNWKPIVSQKIMPKTFGMQNYI